MAQEYRVRCESKAGIRNANNVTLKNKRPVVFYSADEELNDAMWKKGIAASTSLEDCALYLKTVMGYWNMYEGPTVYD